MDYLSRYISQPQQQSADETIKKLCNRLDHSTLLEDRRAAILGLKNFSRDYRQVVAKEGLDGLLQVLKKDREDVDVLKAVLETFIIFFSPKDLHQEFATWLSEEFTKTADNVVGLLDALDCSDFYVRLYTLQILGTLSQNRSDRVQQSIISSPTGISRLVSILDDRRDAVRSECLSFLISLTEDNADIQKLVVFENTVDKIFKIIELEDGLEDGITVPGCLQLTRNILQYNFSNQSYFKETGGITRISRLLSRRTTHDWSDQLIQNTIDVLSLCKMFVLPSSAHLHVNQKTLSQSNAMASIMLLSLHASIPPVVQAHALTVCACIIRGNTVISEGFSSRELPAGFLHARPLQVLFVLLLNLSTQEFDLEVRFAAASCIEAYIYENPVARRDLVEKIVSGFNTIEQSNTSLMSKLTTGSETAFGCLLETLLHMNDNARRDPYKVWFSANVLSHLLFYSPGCKSLARSVVLGDASVGEETVTAIQTMSANLVISLRHNHDERISIAYLSLLCVWLWEDPNSVTDFLYEASSLQTLVSTVTQSSNASSLVQGLSACLLGICYEFNDEKSPIPRTTLQQILHSRIGKDQFVARIARLRENPLFRDVSESYVLPSSRQDGLLPDIYFNLSFVEFLKDHYSRIQKSIEKGPGTSTNGNPNRAMSVEQAQKMVSMEREIVQLREQSNAKEKKYQIQLNELNIGVASTKNTISQLEQHQAQLLQELETTMNELSTIKGILNERNEKLKQRDSRVCDLETELDDLMLVLSDLEDKRQKDKLKLKELGELVSDIEEE
ncbi:Intracellular protein transport protein USO1 [Neolecta irregularis DAH-3]|uniref:Intracellular protein transport protein USO1 n=1 Tax=Neolecta irregularis (strain DAH-3) TaxID=1198029 RepID=A0A1U7LJ78_NEOID|nr:Intracellular protein transport protein USO1 [Neolecta irregularis DAH-3]|eukprot:OLL22699.1 Intracellular protein transport protein USO1 [Neolecta irregularis DAH-3]